MAGSVVGLLSRGRRGFILTQFGHHVSRILGIFQRLSGFNVSNKCPQRTHRHIVHRHYVRMLPAAFVGVESALVVHRHRWVIVRRMAGLFGTGL